jgi:hypothetical protein
MKRIVHYVSLIVLLVALTTCEDYWPNCIDGNGNPVDSRRTIARFDQLVSAGSFDVYYTKSGSTSLRINAESNLIPYIRTYVVGGKLHIDVEENRCLQNNDPINIYISAPELKALELKGSGQIACDTIISEEFRAINSGSGDIEIGYLFTDFLQAGLSGSGNIEMEGEATDGRLQIFGSGNLRAIGLEQRKCRAGITGSGDMFVFVTKELDAEISGSGNIYYKGDPTIESKITGSGKIMKY